MVKVLLKQKSSTPVPNPLHSDILILGGGLAGLTNALHLAKAGLHVRLLEKGEYPRHKVCGEYISNEVLPYLDSLGFEPFSLGATAMERCLLSTVEGKTVEAPLPLGGFGLSRYRMDDELYKLVLAQGGEILQETVEEVEFSGDQFTVSTRSGQVYTAPLVIGAFGKRSKLDVALDRPFMQKNAPYLGVKAHYAGDFPEDLVALYNFDGGYCGVSKVEDGRINICYLANYDTFKTYKNLATYEQEVVRKNPLLNDILNRVTPLFDRPLTISQISFASKENVREHVLMSGDAAGMIHPLCGNGMGMAITSAQLLSQEILQYFASKHPDRQRLEAAYTAQWQQQFRKRLLFGRAFNALFYRPQLFAASISMLTVMPRLLPFFIRQTHGEGAG